MNAVLQTPTCCDWRDAIRTAVQTCQDVFADMSLRPRPDDEWTHDEWTDDELEWLLKHRCNPILQKVIRKEARAASLPELSEALLENALQLLLNEYKPGRGIWLFIDRVRVVFGHARYGKLRVKPLRVIECWNYPCPNHSLSYWLFCKALRLLERHTDTPEEHADRLLSQARQVANAGIRDLTGFDLSAFVQKPEPGDWRTTLDAAIESSRNALANIAGELFQRGDDFDLSFRRLEVYLDASIGWFVKDAIAWAMKHPRDPASPEALSTALLQSSYRLLIARFGERDGTRLFVAIELYFITGSQGDLSSIPGDPDFEAGRTIESFEEVLIHECPEITLTVFLFWTVLKIMESHDRANAIEQRFLAQVKQVVSVHTGIPAEDVMQLAIMPPEPEAGDWREGLDTQLNAYRNKLSMIADSVVQHYGRSDALIDKALCDQLTGNLAKSLSARIDDSFHAAPESVSLVQKLGVLMETAHQLMVNQSGPDAGFKLFNDWASAILDKVMHLQQDNDRETLVVREITPGYLGADMAMAAFLIENVARTLYKLEGDQTHHRMQDIIDLATAAGKGQRRVS